MTTTNWRNLNGFSFTDCRPFWIHVFCFTSLLPDSRKCSLWFKILRPVMYRFWPTVVTRRRPLLLEFPYKRDWTDKPLCNVQSQHTQLKPCNLTFLFMLLNLRHLTNDVVTFFTKQCSSVEIKKKDRREWPLVSLQFINKQPV